ncbi:MULTISPECIES: TFIIB-type zinc ribbon-containing protein [Bacillus amyloliquefaciens group]|uniref:TFIIB-type zinc ribbon-containing protein n=1 Tax=Bacillus amyloliquefaciens group TaxID=1938374 RepID=UPI0013642417|nr:MULTISPECIES: TFIIB-type zinc ribbon-containing protein [Bacillus amyloliquefaciens group]MBO3649378.1 TFIIB-type zinc ribbon-containing protein [Bacillus amyloliquefaciens]MCJ2175984.1 TFIIB-type zinc ribbon-containing protein [Bacillus amyloliquefaciens]MCR4350691.1 TFIIB-type zinc ribbon-containing protein [Bacillus amyloliquefaciens]MCR4359394.1 TFIIB-type zinc ribbon-containing protein [Bacillus amyloliquefaciens]MEC1482580.1 TFIIB-type zinc ribbon-containing protein [Bacillus velezens
MIISYKCPNCGDDMVFDSSSGMLTCHSCGRQDQIESLPKEYITTRFSENEANEYRCENCGAVLMTEAETTATTCGFCGGAAVLADRLSGNLAPSMVIPFTISKEEAMSAFKKWCRNGRLTPKGFMSADRVKSITGMYVPFWMFDLNSKVQVNAVCTRVHHYEDGEYRVTETEYYNAYRDINLDYLKIPVDASEKMSDELMDKLEPYSYSELKEFNTAYLAGYIAEKYNYTDDDLFPRAKDKISHYIDSYIRSTFSGYTTADITDEQIQTDKISSFYVLLPVWMVSYDYERAEHIFAMNGQTGKVVGKPPISAGKVAAWFGGITAGAFLALRLVSLMIGGGF